MLGKRQKTGVRHTKRLIVVAGHRLQERLSERILSAVIWPALKMCKKALRCQAQVMQRQYLTRFFYLDCQRGKVLRFSVASGKTSSSAEIFSSDLNEVVSSIRKVVEVCEVAASHVAESAASTT